MRVSAHLALLYMATTFWTLFYLAGLPSGYYQTWHWLPVVLLGWIAPAAGLWLVGPRLLRATRAPARESAFWAAFYFSGPYLVYDYVVLGLHEGRSWSYLLDFWYLTFFTPIPWVVFGALSIRGPPQG